MRLLRCCAPPAAVASCVVALSACVERKEHLTIYPDGAVLYQITHRSESMDDLYNGDAVPRIAGGWIARQEIQKDNEGKETISLIAEAQFAPRAKLPANFAMRGEGDADLYLQFPTTVTVEQRPDGWYYHFARTYPARSYAQIEMLRDRLVQQPLSDLKSLEPKDWTPAERIKVVRALANFETEKLLTFARSAYVKAAPGAPQDGWLAVRRYVHDCLEQTDYESLAKLLEPRVAEDQVQSQEAMIQVESDKFHALLSEHLQEGLRTLAGLDGSQTSLVMAEYDRCKRAFDVTEDLGDDKFEIKVDMPGVIVESNADSTDGQSATWSFDGQIIRDREIELLVTSRVAK